MSDSTRDLADFLNQQYDNARTASPMLRQGVIQTVSGASVTLTLNGTSNVVKSAYLASYQPLIGDTVWVLRSGATLLVIGSQAGSAPAVWYSVAGVAVGGIGSSTPGAYVGQSGITATMRYRQVGKSVTFSYLISVSSAVNFSAYQTIGFSCPAPAPSTVNEQDFLTKFYAPGGSGNSVGFASLYANGTQPFFQPFGSASSGADSGLAATNWTATVANMGPAGIFANGALIVMSGTYEAA